MKFVKRKAVTVFPSAVGSLAPVQSPDARSLADWYYEQARKASQSRVDSERRLSKFAWRAAGVAIAVAVVTFVGSAALVQLKRPTPPIVIRDNTATGNVEVIGSALSGNVKWGELEDRADLSRYVEGREGYDWETIQDKYDLVRLMSAGKERSQYEAMFDGPNAPQKVLKDQYRVIAKVGAITFVGSTAQVFFSKKLIPLGGATMLPRIEYWVATIAYDHQDLPSKDSERVLDPTGFVVTSYTVDRDWTRSSADAPTPVLAAAASTSAVAAPVSPAVPALTPSVAGGAR